MLFGKAQSFAHLKTSTLSNQGGRARFFIFGPGDIGDSIDDAKDLGKFKKSSSYDGDGDVGGNDLDYYKFKLKKDGNLKIKIKSDDSNRDPIQFSIVDKRDKTISVNGKRLFTEVNDGDKGKLSGRLNQGTYYVKIESEDGDGEDYSFKLKFEGSGDDNND